jgi:hypothetical protein
MKLPLSTTSGAYVERGPQELQLYASIPKSDALVAVLEIDTDSPGQVYHYFMRGGIAEGRMTIDELRAGATATVEMLAIARELWPSKTVADAVGASC